MKANRRFWNVAEPGLVILAVLTFWAGAAAADFDAEVTASPGFAKDLTRVVVIAVSCHESIDCHQVEDRAAADLVERRPGFEVVSPATLREKVFARGEVALTEEMRPAVLEELGVDGVLEIRVPFANRGDGFGGRRRSEVRVEVRLVTPDDKLLMSGRGSGRPKNVVSGTERVAGRVLEKIFEKAFR